jgi:hypothetical protein
MFNSSSLNSQWNLPIALTNLETFIDHKDHINAYVAIRTASLFIMLSEEEYLDEITPLIDKYKLLSRLYYQKFELKLKSEVREKGVQSYINDLFLSVHECLSLGMIKDAEAFLYEIPYSIFNYGISNTIDYQLNFGYLYEKYSNALAKQRFIN